MDAVKKEACSGGNADYACLENPGKCSLYCREIGGSWERVRIQKDLILGPFEKETCPKPKCDDSAEQFCHGSWPGEPNCKSKTSKVLRDECSGTVEDSVAWTFSVEVETELTVKVPFCAEGSTSVKVGGSRKSSVSWKRTFQCNPAMTLPGCHECSSSGGQCDYSCSVVRITTTANAALKLRIKVYYKNYLIGQEVCDNGNEGYIQLVMTEWAQPNGCISINDAASECSYPEGQCMKPPPTPQPTSGLPTPSPSRLSEPPYGEPPPTPQPTIVSPTSSPSRLSEPPYGEPPHGDPEHPEQRAHPDAGNIPHIRKRNV